jgi:hypothetical protein
MTLTTGQQVTAILEQTYRARRQHDNKLRGISPLRPDSNSGTSFVVHIEPDGEYGWYKDFVSGESGSLYQLAEYLKIPVPRKEATQTKRVYTTLAEYAEAHGVPVTAFEDAKWIVGEKDNRPTFLYPTQTGTIARFMDGETPTYKSPVEYKACWYGLKTAVPLAKEKRQPLVYCNGAPSVVAAQHHGIPAFCKTGGENAPSEDLLKELDEQWTGDIILAPDCDNTGTRWRKEVQALLGTQARVADLGLTDKGDLADFCMLYKDTAMRELQKRAFKIPEQDEPDPDLTFVSSDRVFTGVIAALTEPDGLMSIENPFNVLHQYGGMAHILAQNEIMGIVAPSAGGKTIWMETGLMNLVRRGVHSIVISAEWMDKAGLKFGFRMVQRLGGPSYEQFQMHQLALRAKANKLPCNGFVELTDAEIQKTMAIIKQQRSLPGRNYYGTVPGLSAERVVKAIRKYHTEAVREGNKPSVVWIDYGQQLWLEHQERSSRMPLDVAMEIIRAECNDLELALIVASQMKKDDAERARAGEKFELSSMQWMSEQPFQLLLFAVPWVIDGEPQRNKDGYELLRCQILKNSTGKQSPVFPVPWKPDRLWVYDTPHSSYKPELPTQRVMDVVI